VFQSATLATLGTTVLPPKATSFIPQMNKKQWTFLLWWQKTGIYNMVNYAIRVKLSKKFMLTEDEAEKIQLEYCEHYENLAAHFGFALKDLK